MRKLPSLQISDLLAGTQGAHNAVDHGLQDGLGLLPADVRHPAADREHTEQTQGRGDTQASGYTRPAAGGNKEGD